MRRFYRLDLVGAAMVVAMVVAIAVSGCTSADETTGELTQLAVGSGIDLVESNVADPPTTATVGDSFPVGDTVGNTGTDPAGASTTVYLLSLNGTQKAPGTKALGTRAVGGIASGGMDSGSASATIPAGTAQGTYYVLACADQSNAVTETNEMNNCSASANTVAISAPDLTESNVTMSPSAVDSLGSLSITESVNDVTMTGAGQSTTRFYFSTDNVKSSDDGFVRACVSGGLTPGRVVSPIAGGGTDTGTTAVPLCERDASGLHAVPAGTYYVIACADELQDVFESDETNNCAVSAATFQVTVCGNGTTEPGEACDDGNTTAGDGCSATCQVESPADLIETAVSNPPANANVNGGFSVTDTAANQGTASAGASTTQYYLSADQVRDVNDTQLTGSRAVPTLAGGANSSDTVTVTIPPMNAGTYYLLACADAANAVTESNENNNCIASATTVLLGGADLLETVVSDPPATAPVGSSFSIDDTVRNGGLAGAGNSVTHFYLSLDRIHTAPGTRLLGGRSVGPLGSNNTSAATTTLTVSADTPEGTYYILACADHTNLVSETNEANNCLASTNTVALSAPDLVEQGVSATPTSVASGSPVSVTETVANATTTSAGVSFTRYYLSTDNVWTTADPLLRNCSTGAAIERSVPALAGGATSQGTTSVATCVKTPALQPVAPGAYFLFACADQHTTVAESNEKNNCTSVAITVTP